MEYMTQRLTEPFRMRLDPQTLADLQRVAKANERSAGGEVRRALSTHIKQELARLQAEGAAT